MTLDLDAIERELAQDGWGEEAHALVAGLVAEVRRLQAVVMPLRDSRVWLVWSNEHGAWWGPNRAGYYIHLGLAGRYTFAEAPDICEHARSHGPTVRPERMVPSPELLAAMAALAASR